MTHERLVSALLVGVERVQVFTWVDAHAEVWHFNVSAMLEDYQRGPLPLPGTEHIGFVLDPDQIAWIVAARGVDRGYARTLSAAALTLPVLAFYDPTRDETLTVDGHHRMVRWFDLGVREGPMVRFAWTLRERYRIVLPPDLAGEVIADLPAPVPHPQTGRP